MSSRTVKIVDVKVGERFRKSIGDLSGLVESIKDVGLLHPIVVSEGLTLIAGYRRIRACQLMGLKEIPATIVNLPDLRKGEVHENMVRKNFIVSEMVAVKRAMEPEVKEEHPVGNPHSNCADSAQLTGEKSRAVLASYVGVSHDTLAKAEVIVEAAEREPEKYGALLAKVDNETISVNAAYQKIKQAEKPVNFEPQLYNIWSFQTCDPHFGDQNFTGRIPGQIVQNVLYYFSSEDELVVDPMAGGGTVLDVCKNMNRRALCYDIAPVREDIRKHDVRLGYPVEAQNCNLIFLDPPYFNMVFDDFHDLNEFYGFIKKLAQDTHKTLKQDGYVAFLIEDMTEKGNYCLSGEGYRIFRDVNFECAAHISCPLSSQQFNAQQVEKAKTEKRLLGRNRDLYIFKKAING